MLHFIKQHLVLSAGCALHWTVQCEARALDPLTNGGTLPGMADAQLTCGIYSISIIVVQKFRLDGGSMFGAIPRPLWQRWITPDAENRIPMAARVLLLESAQHRVLIDTGCGECWPEKFSSIYAIETLRSLPELFQSRPPTHVILTHLHFDHAGGMRDLIKCLKTPLPEVIVQRRNFDYAKAPHRREAASYRREVIDAIEGFPLRLVEGAGEVLPQIHVSTSDGHTEGMQTIEIRGADCTVLYPADLLPTAHHLPATCHMGYDMCARQVLKEKDLLLQHAAASSAYVVLEHDPDTEGVRVKRSADGGLVIA